MKTEIQILAEIALKRTGGINAINGFAYQFQYSVYKILSEFNNSSNNQNYFKIEGVEDLDFYINNTQGNNFYQVKYSKNTFTTTNFNDKVLKNLLEVYLKVPDSNFFLVTNKHIAGGELNDVKKSNQKNKQIEQKTLDYWSEKCNEIRSKTENWKWTGFDINDFLSKIQFQTINNKQINSKTNKLLSQFLVSVGITSVNTELYENTIYNNVFLWAKKPQNIFHKDIIQIIDNTRNAIAKGTINNAVKGEWIKPVNFENTYNKDYIQSYFDGKPARPYHIAENLPVRRENWEKQIIEIFNSSDITIIQASSGQGKSTLAWQVIFNLNEKGYHPYELFECKKTEQIGELVQFIHERIKIGEKPIIVLDGLNENIKEWKELIKRTSDLPIKYLITTREEDWFYYGTTYLPVSTKHVYISMDYDEAGKIYNQFKKQDKLYSEIESWQPVWEKVKEKGLLIEFVYYITHGQMMRDRLKEQYKKINQDVDKIEILRLVSTASLCNVKLKSSQLIDFIAKQYNKKDINTTLKSLDKEYQISIKGQNYIEGLHPVRSRHLSEILHENIPISYTLKRLLPLIDIDDLFAFSSYAPILLKNPNEKDDFLQHLAKQSNILDYIAISNIINGTYSTDAKLHWEKNKSIYDKLFEGGGGLVYAIDILPWHKPTFKPIIEKNLNSDDKNEVKNAEFVLENYNSIEEFIPEKSNTYKLTIALFEIFHNTELKSNLNGLSDIARWFDRFDIECQLIQQITFNHLKLNFQILDIYSFGNLLWAIHKFNSELFFDFFKNNKQKIISVLKAKTKTPTIQLTDSYLKIEYFHDIQDDSNLNTESVERIELFSLYFPYISNFKTSAIYPPLSIFRYFTDSYDPSIKNISINENFVDKFTLNTNQIWLKRVKENYEFPSLYDWQKFVFEIRRNAIELIKHYNNFLEKLFEGNQNIVKKKGAFLDKQKEKVLLLYKKEKTIDYDSSFSELKYKQHIEKIKSWLSSLNNAVVQLFPNDDDRIRVFKYNVITVKNDLLKAQESFNFISNQTIKYFDTDELCKEEIYWYSRFSDTISYYSVNKININCVNAKLEIQQWKKEKENEIINHVDEIIDYFENSTGLKCIKPIKIFTDNIQKGVLIGLLKITPEEFDKVFDVIIANLLDFVDVDIEKVILVFVKENQLIQNQGISISKHFINDLVTAIENETDFDIGFSRPSPVEITEEHILTLPNVTFSSNVDLSNETITQIIISLWKLSEIKKRISDVFNIERKWRKNMENEVVIELQKLTKSPNYLQQHLSVRNKYNQLVEDVIYNNEIVKDEEYEKLFQGLIYDTQNNIMSNKVSSVFDMFTTDFNSIPDDSYTQIDTEVNSSGDKIKKYKKKLNQKEYGLFDKVEIILFESSMKNVIFSASGITILSLPVIESFINTLFSVYGADSENQEELNIDEKCFILQNPLLVNRQWETNDIGFAVNFDDGHMNFTIWGC